MKLDSPDWLDLEGLVESFSDFGGCDWPRAKLRPGAESELFPGQRVQHKGKVYEVIRIDDELWLHHQPIFSTKLRAEIYRDGEAIGWYDESGKFQLLDGVEFDPDTPWHLSKAIQTLRSQLYTAQELINRKLQPKSRRRK